MRNIEIKNLKYLIPLILFPILVFSALTVSKIIFEPQNLVPAGFKSDLKMIRVGNNAIKAEIASTPDKWEKGLSGRSSLPKNQGMLFVFPSSDYHSFWMKDMRFSLDFIWIRGDKVVQVTPRVKPEDYQLASARRSEPPKVLVPKEKVDKVLEIGAGMAESLNIKIGDTVVF